MATPGFELPGAIVTGAGASKPTLTISQLSSGLDPVRNQYYARCQFTSSQASDKTANVLLASPERSSSTCQASVWAQRVPLGQVVDLPIAALLTTPNGLNQDDILELVAVTSSGALGYQEFTFGG